MPTRQLLPLERHLLQSQLDVIRLGGAVSRDIANVLADARNELAAAVERTSPDQLYSRSFQTILSQQIDGALLSYGEETRRRVLGEQEFVIEQEYRSATAALLRDAGRLVPPVQPLLPVSRLAALASRPLGGQALSTWIDGHIGHLRQGIRRELGVSETLGEGSEAAARRLREAFGLSRNGADVIARTALLSAAAEARDEVFKENSDLIVSYTWMATLDRRTCFRCGPLDGREEKNRTDFPPTPLHARCRCIIRADTRLAKEKRNQETLTRPAVREVEARKVQHRDGSTSTSFRPIRESVHQVSASVTFEDFFASLPRDGRREYLGAWRFAQYEAGLLDLGDLKNRSDHSQRTIPELRAIIRRRGDAPAGVN